ncbi:MAG: hypothetical protein U1E26_08860 [Coriobacteriia bacterium]|nr:hypothetical protein [Coriobacteriia bacterium]
MASAEAPSMPSSLNTAEVPDGCGVAIEFGVPYTSSRIDFLLTGRAGGIADSPATDSAVIIELKQWESLEAIREARTDLLPLRTAVQSAEHHIGKDAGNRSTVTSARHA